MTAIILRSMTATEYANWLPSIVDSYAHGLHRAGQASAEAARDTAERQIANLLPDGLDTEDMLLFTADGDSGRPVGWIWLRLPSTVHGRDAAWVCQVVVHAAERGKGYGRAIMRAAEEELTSRGVARVGLNVFTHNTVALGLYESLGFEVRAQQMVKSLG